MNIVLHDFDKLLDFAPLTLTRPVGDLRMGIFTNKERWQALVPSATVSFKTAAYLSAVFPTVSNEDTIWWNAAVIPTLAVIPLIAELQKGEGLYLDDLWVAYRGEIPQEGFRKNMDASAVIAIHHRWDIYQLNDQVLKNDFEIKTRNKVSAQLSDTNRLIGPKERLYIAPSAKVEGAILNTSTGVIYIDEDAEIMEGSIVRGGLYLGEHAALKLGAKVYGATTLGPHCKVGGEVNNVVFQAFSNKGHDGFLGNSVVGEWCNLGADTNTSNLKNNYGRVKAFDYKTQQMAQTNLQFMGLMMGDHSKSGINTMFNTATVVGVSATVFGAGFPPKYVHDFSWGGFDAASRFDFNKAIEAANNMMVRRGVRLSSEEIAVLEHIFKGGYLN